MAQLLLTLSLGPPFTGLVGLSAATLRVHLLTANQSPKTVRQTPAAGKHSHHNRIKTKDTPAPVCAPFRFYEQLALLI